MHAAEQPVQVRLALPGLHLQAFQQLRNRLDPRTGQPTHPGTEASQTLHLERAVHRRVAQPTVPQAFTGLRIARSMQGKPRRSRLARAGLPGCARCQVQPLRGREHRIRVAHGGACLAGQDGLQMHGSDAQRGCRSRQGDRVQQAVTPEPTEMRQGRQHPRIETIAHRARRMLHGHRGETQERIDGDKAIQLPEWRHQQAHPVDVALHLRGDVTRVLVHFSHDEPPWRGVAQEPHRSHDPSCEPDGSRLEPAPPSSATRRHAQARAASRARRPAA